MARSDISCACVQACPAPGSCEPRASRWSSWRARAYADTASQMPWRQLCSDSRHACLQVCPVRGSCEPKSITVVVPQGKATGCRQGVPNAMLMAAAEL